LDWLDWLDWLSRLRPAGWRIERHLAVVRAITIAPRIGALRAGYCR